MIHWLIIGVLLLLLLVSGGITLAYRWNLKQTTHQLSNILENFGTNQLIRTTSQNKDFKLLVMKINQLIDLYKKDQRHVQKKTEELRQEITNISHDLRTPLTSIKGFSELLQEGNLTSEEKQAFLKVIQNKIDNLTTTVDLFYEISKIESLDETLFLESLSLEEMVTQNLLTFYNDFEAGKISLDYEENHLPNILADKNAVNRIIINVIQNALRYSKSYFYLTFTETANQVILQARNDADELNSETISRVFERSFSMDVSRSRGQNGLGLYIVEKLVTKQEGIVTASINGNEFVLEIAFPKAENN